MTDELSLQSLQQKLREFVTERGWQGFHTPKNLVMALVGEVGELTEIFQWLKLEESAQVMVTPAAEHVREELADVFAYLLRLSDVLDVDLLVALEKKIALNAERYPIEKARGSSRNYTQLDGS
jgi:dCTP diphosphatase